MSKEWLEFLKEDIENQRTSIVRLNRSSAVKLVERVQELENRNKELEYASKYNGDLNSFLQKRKLPANTLGRHVVNVVMDYVQGLEQKVRVDSELFDKQVQQNKRYREALEFYADKKNYHQEKDFGTDSGVANSNVMQDGGELARKELEELK